MSVLLIQQPGQHYDSSQNRGIRANRTGGNTAVGQVGFVDSPQSDAASTTIDLGLDNVVAITTSLIGKAPRLVVAQGIIADDDRGEFIEGDGIKCQILVDGTTDVAIGDKLKPANAATSLVKATCTNPYSVNEGGAANPVLLDVWYAEALEARTTNSAALLWCMLFSSGKR